MHSSRFVRVILARAGAMLIFVVSCVCLFVCVCFHFQFFWNIPSRQTHALKHTHTNKTVIWWHRHQHTHTNTLTQEKTHMTHERFWIDDTHMYTVKYSENSRTIWRIGRNDSRRSLQPLNGRLEWSRNSRKAPTHHALRDNRTERRGADLRAISRSAANPRGVAPYPIFQHLASRNVFQN